MTKIIRNAILTVATVAGLATSAYAGQTTIYSCSNHDDYYSICLGANNGDHHDSSRGDRR